MCVYVCMCMFVFVCVCVCVYKCLCMFARARARVCVCVYVPFTLVPALIIDINIIQYFGNFHRILQTSYYFGTFGTFSNYHKRYQVISGKIKEQFSSKLQSLVLY
jgi:hypothetical protein